MILTLFCCSCYYEDMKSSKIGKTMINLLISLRKKLKMNSEDKITCWVCGTVVIEYFEVRYKGKRGRCPTCEINFPLE